MHADRSAARTLTRHHLVIAGTALAFDVGAVVLLPLAAAFVLPAVSRTLATGLHLPLAPLVMAALYALILRRGAAPDAEPPRPAALAPAAA